jgi:hypothetical protein
MGERQKAASRRHYAKHRKKVLASVQAYKDKKKAEWRRYKRTLSCTKCGIKHPAVIDFHHVDRDDPNKQKVHKLVCSGRFKAAYKEIEKCMVLCANCHRILHYEETHGKDTDSEEAT